MQACILEVTLCQATRDFTSGAFRGYRGMETSIDHGFLVLADVSGFTAFVTATEIEHGPPIIAELLGEVIGQLSPPLEIQEVEGDAVFALAPDQRLAEPADLVPRLEGAFTAFRHRQRELQGDESCACAACRGVGSLDLKVVVHHGRFLRHQVGGRPQVAGADVILAHRLLKNGAGRKGGYVLLTEPAVQRMGLDPGQAGLAPHRERYEHLGDVQCFVGDVAGAGTVRRESRAPAMVV